MQCTKNEFGVLSDDAVCERTTCVTENSLTYLSEDLAFQLIEEPLNLNFGQLDDSVNLYQNTNNANAEMVQEKVLFAQIKNDVTQASSQLSCAPASSEFPRYQQQDLSRCWQNQVYEPQGQHLGNSQNLQHKVSVSQEIRYHPETQQQQQLHPQLQHQQQQQLSQHIQQQFGVLEEQQQQQQQMQQHQFMQFGIGIPAGVELQNQLVWQQQNSKEDSIFT
eukprot:TRINITY_DN7643_c0_g5_i2.p1 TRINITY_DN7643_c0_g5~~TRINITY_DN7643_c0_g5_i2.p1  ORF type:complete len:241 (-),score=14.66 TRINITY_DN7643_c0_g5_i2:46-705(-)